MNWSLFALVAALVLASLRFSFVKRGDQVLQAEADRRCFPALFSFGSSVADTGAQAAALPFARPARLPFGSTYFGKPSNRYCDGRLHIDFWALALGLPFLDPYLRSVGSNYRRGANFAASGSTARNETTYSPFPLAIQLNQFVTFKNDVIDLIHSSRDSWLPAKDPDIEKLPREEYFRDALYVIAIGGNDFIRWYFSDELAPEEVESRVPEVSQLILHVVEELHAEGARHILVEDMFPQGCMPNILSRFAGQYADQLDSAGCLKPFNALVQLHNSFLKHGILELGKRLKDASIAVIDTYNPRYDMILNYGKYGFQVPVRTCCGTGGGDYNYRADCLCGSSSVVDGQTITAKACENISSHIMWDGIHFTDAANRATMRAILSGHLFEPRVELIPDSCFLREI